MTEGLWVQHQFTPPNAVEHPPFNHHLLSLLLNDEPRQVSCFNGREYDGPRLKGEFFILPAEEPSAFHWENTDESIAFIIDPLFLQEVARENECLNPDQVELLPTLMGKDSTLESMALLFKQEMHRLGLGGRLFSESLANCFATHLLRYHCAFEACPRNYKGGLSTRKLRLAIDYIQANLDQKLSLRIIAQELHMSQFYFSELFKQSMGIPPYKYVLQQRVERSRQLLKNHELPITDIAYQCGFANQTHLTKHFRKVIGMTPKKYRKTII